MWDSTVLNLWMMKEKTNIFCEDVWNVCGFVGRRSPLPVSCEHHCCWVVAEGLQSWMCLGYSEASEHHSAGVDTALCFGNSRG